MPGFFVPDHIREGTMADLISVREGAYCEVQVRGGVALVDEQDVPLIAGYNWRVDDRGTKNLYVIATRGIASYRMHRVILGAQAGFVVDHVNGNGLDNRRSNLRICEHRENIRNQRAQLGTTSPFKGVRAKQGRWVAAIEQNGEQLHLGTFKLEHDAALQYDRAARLLFGAFARTNADEGLYQMHPNRLSAVVGSPPKGRIALRGRAAA